MTERPIYMDNNSTTRVDPRVLEAMLPYFCEMYGNASSVSHMYGWEASSAVDSARSQIGQLINADPKSIVFTSGATESNNLALKGVLLAAKPGSHLIVNAAEHKAILDPAEELRKIGFEVTSLKVDHQGMVTPEQVEKNIRPNTVLVSVMYANNEVGTVNPIQEIGKVCRSHEVLFHTDATQALSTIPINLKTMPIDLMSFSAHKIYGPKGIGALFVKRSAPRIKMSPLLHGGGHELRLRSGTLAVPLIVGFGAACALCKSEMTDEQVRLTNLRNRLLLRLSEYSVESRLNGHPSKRLSGNVNITLSGVNSEALMMHLKEVVAISSGSACTSADPEPSHVLTAMGLEANQIESTIRIGLGRFNTESEIDTVASAISQTVKKLQKLL